MERRGDECEGQTDVKWADSLISVCTRCLEKTRGLKTSHSYDPVLASCWPLCALGGDT